MKTLALVMVAVAIAGCAKDSPHVTEKPVASAAKLELAPDARRLIVEKERALTFNFAEPKKTAFTPDPSDVAALEAALPGYLRAKAPPTSRPGKPPLADRAAGYYRQYTGYVDDDGTKVIWSNFFCYVIKEIDWQKSAVAVDDGGDCYFQIEFVPAKREFRKLEINGDA